jgi:hypothetical protein
MSRTDSPGPFCIPSSPAQVPCPCRAMHNLSEIPSHMSVKPRELALITICNTLTRKTAKIHSTVEWTTPMCQLACAFVLASRKRFEPELTHSSDLVFKLVQLLVRFDVGLMSHSYSAFAATVTSTPSYGNSAIRPSPSDRPNLTHLAGSHIHPLLRTRRPRRRPNQPTQIG